MSQLDSGARRVIDVTREVKGVSTLTLRPFEETLVTVFYQDIISPILNA
jgi:hypothetical protein